MSEIRVRFPPSPTGYLHIGGARTALYNWLLVKKLGGKLVLRIEDTDEERSTEASAQAILEGLEWMGITWDEGPYLQSDFAEEHRAAADELVRQGKAYRCYCTREELAAKREAAKAAKQSFQGYDGSCRSLSEDQRALLEDQGRPWVVRFKVDRGEGAVSFDDLVFGPTEVSLAELDDFVIVRSNGVPLYVLSNVVDDHRDRITHVLRGADHLVNTPKQVLLYRAMGWEVPAFAHMALTLDPKKAKISKRRHGEVVAVQFYRDHGFLPWAFCNFMALLGWSAGDDREIYETPEDLIQAFTIEGMAKRNSVFNYRKGDPKFITDPKAIHINAQHLRTMPVEILAPHVKQQLEAASIWSDAWDAGGEERDWFLRTLELVRVRYNFLTDFVTLARAFFDDDYPMEEKALRKSLRKDPALADYLPRLADRLDDLEIFDLETTEAALRALVDELSIKPGLLINAARVALTGQGVGPGIFDVFLALGQARTCARLREKAPLCAGE